MSTRAPMPGVELVIFDCDGVLVDSERVVVEVEAQLFAEQGWDIPVEYIVEHFVGLSDAAMRDQLAELTGDQLGREWDRRYAERVRAALTNDVRAVAGIHEVLDQLQTSARRTCVASSGSHDKMALTLGSTRLLERFSGHIYSSTDDAVERGKPHPDLFLHAAASEGVAPARCVVVEDSPHGVAAAIAAGMQPFGYAGSVTPAVRLQRPGVTVFEHMDELVPLIDATDA